MIQKYYKILLFTETWLHTGINDQNIIQNFDYQILRSDRNSKKVGGVLALIQNDIPFIKIIDINKKTYELLVFDILDTKTLGKTRIILTYRPPKIPTKNEFLDYLSTLSEFLCVPYPSFLIGDLNLAEINWINFKGVNNQNKNNLCQIFIDFTKNHELFQLIKYPTRQNKILDLLLTNKRSNIKKIQTLPPFSSNGCQSDHNAFRFSIKLNSCTNFKNGENVKILQKQITK